MDGGHPPFRTATMIRENDFDFEVIPGLGQQPREHAHRVVQLHGIARRMDVARDDGTINPSLSAFFNVVVVCICQQVLGNQLPGFWADPFDILIEGRFLESLIEDTDSAKPSE